jgi:hypothetical protein
VTSAANARSWSTIVLMVFFSSRISPLTSTEILRDRSPRATAVVDLGDVADLRGQVRAHDVDRVGEVLPRAGDAGHDRLHAEPALRCRPRAHARDFRRERSQLLDHRVDGFLELQISPRTSTVIFFERSPLATAIVTSAMLRPGR